MKKQILFTTVFVITFVIMGHADCPNPKWTPTQNVVQLYLDSINNTIPSKGMSLDELNDEREQAVNDLPSEHPDPKLVLPTLIRHLKSDPDEGVRGIIAEMLPSISQDKTVVDALEEVANKQITDSERENMREKFKKAGVKIEWNEDYTLQGTALRSLAKMGAKESIPVMTNWLLNYNVNMFKYGFLPSIKNENEDFRNECVKSVESRLTNKGLTNKERLRFARVEIISLNQSPEKFKKYFIDSLNDKDEGTIEEALNTIQEMQILGAEWIKNKTGKEELINHIKPYVRGIKNKKFEVKIKEIVK
jgi:hypothetical protein